MMKQRHPTLPPLSTDGCTMTNNLTYSDYKNTNFSSIFDESPINATMTYFQQVRNQTIGVQSLLNRNILYILISICKRFSLHVFPYCLLMNIHSLHSTGLCKRRLACTSMPRPTNRDYLIVRFFLTKKSERTIRK